MLNEPLILIQKTVGGLYIMGMENVFYGYARVSTIGQNDTSIEAQLEYLRLQAESLGIPFHPYSEKKSGKNLTDRDVLPMLIEKSREGDVLAVYDNSRLGRNTEENLNIVKLLHKKGVKVQINSKLVDPTILANWEMVAPVDMRFDGSTVQAQRLATKPTLQLSPPMLLHLSACPVSFEESLSHSMQ
jgi:hypothetical protein